MLITGATITALVCLIMAVGVLLIIAVKKKYPHGFGLGTILILGIAGVVTVASIYITTKGKHVWVVEEDAQGALIAKEYRLFSSAAYTFMDEEERRITGKSADIDHTIVVNNTSKTLSVKELAALPENAADSGRDDKWTGIDEVIPVSIHNTEVHIEYVTDDRHAPPKKFLKDNRKKNKYLLAWEQTNPDGK